MRIAHAHALALDLAARLAVCNDSKLGPDYHACRCISARLYALPGVLEATWEGNVLLPILPNPGKQGYALGDVVCRDGVLVGRVPVRVFEGRGGSAGRFLVPAGEGLEREGCLVVVQRGDDPGGGHVRWDVVRHV